MKRLAVLMTVWTVAFPALADERFPEIKPEAMTPGQKAIVDAIASSPRRSAAGPFNAWLRSPELVDRLQQVGQYVRYQSSLPPRMSEFAILLTSRFWNTPYIWASHYPLAVEAGVSATALADLAEGRAPSGMDADETLVYTTLSELRDARRVSDAIYAKALERLGERGIIDLVAAAGYFDIVCMTLNVAEVPVPTTYRGLPLTVPTTAAAEPVPPR